MSSRKTYFGIGWSGKDPTAAPKQEEQGDDRSDYSAPTVVDDAKVAEGLKQLRAWYQPDAGADAASGEAASDRESVADSPSEPTKLGMPFPRPTSVGHAAATTREAEQRPILPDPMRGTMFGHDVHRPELDSPNRVDAGAESSSVPLSFVSADLPLRGAETATHPTEPAAQVDGAGGDHIPFADFLRREADRPRWAAGFHLGRSDDTDSIAVPRGGVTARFLFALFGVAAFLTAVVIWLQSGTPEPLPVEPVAGTRAAPPPAITTEPSGARPAGLPRAAEQPTTPAAPSAQPRPPAPLAGSDVAAPRGRVAPATELAKPQRSAPAAAAARTAPPESPRRTADPARTPPVETSGGVDDGRETAEPAVAASPPADAPAPEKTEPRAAEQRTPARSARERGATRRSDPDTSARSETSQREKPAGKQEDPDSTLPPSED